MKRVGSIFILFLCVVLSMLCLSTQVFAEAPGFTKTFTPATIGPGNVSTLTFTITADSAGPVNSIAFTDNLPQGMKIAIGPNVVNGCGGTLNAPEDGTTITYTDGELGVSSSCIISVDVTATGEGQLINTTGDLTSDAGNSGSATANLTIDTTKPSFSKVFAPASIGRGGRSTLTFTIDNTAVGAGIVSLYFIDSLPDGLVLADPVNASTTCGSANTPPTLTATAGSALISLGVYGYALQSYYALEAESSCTVSVDVVADTSGIFVNSSSDLQASGGSCGKANAEIVSSSSSLHMTTEFVDDPAPPGGNVVLDFVITNSDRNHSATSVAFKEDFSAALTGLTFETLVSSDCGGTIGGTGTTSLELTGGEIDPTSSCTISASLAIPVGAVAGFYPLQNPTTPLTATVNGDGISGTVGLDSLFVAPIVLQKEFLDATDQSPDPVVVAGDDVIARYTITNNDQNTGASQIEFIDELTIHLPNPVTVVLPQGSPCGDGSAVVLADLGSDRQGISFTGGILAAGADCSFDITITTPDTMVGGTYPMETEEITALIGSQGVTGHPATDDLVIASSAPQLTKTFVDDPVVSGGTVTLEFTLTHTVDSSADATGITFTDDLATVLTGLTANLPSDPNPPCGTGSTFVGTVGDTVLTLTGGTLAPGESCTFSVVLDVPADASAGNYTNTTSAIAAMIDGYAATSVGASDVLSISDLTFSKEFLTNPVFPNESTTLQFNIQNAHPSEGATDISFEDDLDSVLTGLAATGAATTNTCGGTLTGATILEYSGGSLASGSSCTIEVPVLVPSDAENGNYTNTTTTLLATQGGESVTVNPATDILVVHDKYLQLTKEFTDNPTQPGGTANLEFTLTNLDTDDGATGLSFTDDLVGVLTDLKVDPASFPTDPCGTGSSLAANINNTDLTLSDGLLAAGGSCTFSVTLNIPNDAPTGIYTNTTSAPVGTIDGLPVTGDTASDALAVRFVGFEKEFTDDSYLADAPLIRATAGETVELTFTITNYDKTLDLTALSFADTLDGGFAGFTVLDSLPVNNICGNGSSLDVIVDTSGVKDISTLVFSGGSLAKNSGTPEECSFSVNLRVDLGVTDGNILTNATTDLREQGLYLRAPAIADLIVENDPDGDGVNTPLDNCFFVANADQKDTDKDGSGDSCDDDDDNDNIGDGADNCPVVANTDQSDFDSDGIGDSCDSDSDNDGIPDSWEKKYGMNIYDPLDAVLDNDGDGWSNYEEYGFNSNPNVYDVDLNNNGIPDFTDGYLGTIQSVYFILIGK